MNDLPSAHNWLDAGMIEIATVKCILVMAGDRLDLISKKMDLPQFSPPPPPSYFCVSGFFRLLLWNVSSYSKIKKIVTFLWNTASSYRVLWVWNVTRQKNVSSMIYKIDFKEGRKNILYTIKRRNANWIGHILCRNCLQKHLLKER
jgi:hypothetical protein